MTRKQTLWAIGGATVFVVVAVGLIALLAFQMVASNEDQESLVTEVVQEEEVPEELGDPLDEDAYKNVRREIQKRLLVFDVDQHHDEVSQALLKVVKASDSEDQVKARIRTIVEDRLDDWKRAEIRQSLEVLEVPFGTGDIDRLMEDTSNRAIVDLVVAFEIQWYRKHKGRQ